MSPDQRVWLHIGAMKTGTSYLQHLLTINSDALAADGARYAGSSWGDQVDGVRDVLRMGASGAARGREDGAWQRLVDDLAHGDRRPIVSMEFLSFAHKPGARRVMESLAPAEVHIVLTLRSAGLVLPAQWQELVQNRGTVSWEQWCRDVPDDSQPPTASRASAMRALDVVRMIRAWAPLVPPERLHIVTVPPASASRTLLWERFAQALELRSPRYQTPDGVTNASLGQVSTELLRRLNERLTDEPTPAARYHSVVKSVLAKAVLAQRSGDRKVRLTPGLAEWAAAHDAQTVALLRQTDCDLIGDFADLEVVVPADPRPEPVTEAELLDAAQEATGLLHEQLTGLGERLPPPGRPRDLAQALEQLVQLVVGDAASA